MLPLCPLCMKDKVELRCGEPVHQYAAAKPEGRQRGQGHERGSVAYLCHMI